MVRHIRCKFALPASFKKKIARKKEENEMLIELIGQYYLYLWMMVGAMALLKAFLTYTFSNSYNGFIFSIFNWFGADDKRMEEDNQQQLVMTLLNVFTFLFYLLFIAAVAANLLWLFLGK